MGPTGGIRYEETSISHWAQEHYVLKLFCNEQSNSDHVRYAKIRAWLNSARAWTRAVTIIGPFSTYFRSYVFKSGEASGKPAIISKFRELQQ